MFAVGIHCCSWLLASISDWCESEIMAYRKSSLLKACNNAGMLLHRRREVPQEPLLLVIRSFGGTAAWAGEGSPLDEADESITYQVGQPSPAKGHTVFNSHLLDTWLNRRGNHSILSRPTCLLSGDPKY